MENQVYIIGAGAIGKSLAAFLKSKGRNVIMIKASEDSGKEQDVPLQIILNDGSIVKQSVLLSSFSKQKQFDGVVVLANKSFGNEQIASQIERKIGDSPLVVMQNGLNIEEVFVKRSFQNVYRCVLFSTSQSNDESEVRFKPVSPSPIGVVKGDGSHLTQVIQLLDTPQFRFDGVKDIQPLIWKKVIANCVFNSICPLLDVDNGIFHRDDTASELALDVIKECVTIAKTVGISLDESEVLQTVLRISQSSDGQLISTLQDIRNQRPTEIESLNFAVAEIAARQGMSHLVTKTTLLGELTKLKSQISQ